MGYIETEDGRRVECLGADFAASWELQHVVSRLLARQPENRIRFSGR